MSTGCIHKWKQEYYGIRCTKCDLFYPDNGNWFAPMDDEDDHPDNCICETCSRDTVFGNGDYFDWGDDGTFSDEEDDDFAETELSNDELEDELE